MAEDVTAFEAAARHELVTPNEEELAVPTSRSPRSRLGVPLSTGNEALYWPGQPPRTSPAQSASLKR
ncbi:hypothetical protein GCM10010404_77470 [Nonomuraea africana]